jgi:hypothetical protein
VRSECLKGLLTTLIAGMALHLFLILFTGGYTWVIWRITIQAKQVASPTILLLALVIIRMSLQTPPFRAGCRTHEAVLLFAAILIVYLANGRTIWATDTLPARFLPLSILREGNFDLNKILTPHSQEDLALGPGSPTVQPSTPSVHAPIKGRSVSLYPVGAALFALPFYLPSALGYVPFDGSFLEQLEKLSAATLTALSAVFLYQVLCRLTSRRFARVLTVIYALGTSSLSVSGQALWQHGASQLALTAALYSLVRGRCAPRWLGYAGLPLALAVICRPTNAIVVCCLGLYVGIYHRTALGRCLLSGLPPVLFQLWYNTSYFDYSLRTQYPLLGYWITPLWEGLSGILLSPSRGLFIYAPIFLFSLVGSVYAWRRTGDPLLRYLSVGVLLTTLLYSKWAMWWGGSSYGPRLLADLSPSLVLLLYPLRDLLRERTAIRWTFILVALWSVSAHAIGAFWDDNRWNAFEYRDVKRLQARLWSWTDNQLVNAPKDIFWRALIVWHGLPTSRSAPTLLSATYRVQPPPTLQVTTSIPIQLALEAINDGQAAWLAWTRRNYGAVKLGWRWFKGAHYLPEIPEGRVPLLYDVFPQQAHHFWATIDPPPVPGTYFLEVGMVCEQVTWFADLSTQPIRLTVQVEGQSPTRVQELGVRVIP